MQSTPDPQGDHATGHSTDLQTDHPVGTPHIIHPIILDQVSEMAVEITQVATGMTKETSSTAKTTGITDINPTIGTTDMTRETIATKT